MKSDMMKYKGFKATIAYDEEDKIFVGEVIGGADSLNFHGGSIEELEKAFHECVDNYFLVRERMEIYKNMRNWMNIEKYIVEIHELLKNVIDI